MKLLVIDGNSIINRAFYGIRLLSNKKGQYTNAIFGFINIYQKTVAEVKPDAVAVAFDLKAPTFRHKAYSGYKAHRKGMPEELHMQMKPLKDLLTALGITIVECEGYEADDILGTLAKACENIGGQAFIATGDRDSLQLVTDNITVRLASTKETIIYTPQKIREVYGVEPIDLIEVKALMGDSSDEIPGVAGIGEKTALNLIKEHKTVENLYQNLETATLTPSVRKKLESGYESAKMSRMLAEICTTAPISTDMNDYLLKPVDNEKAVSQLRDLEMYSTIDKLKLDTSNISAEPTVEVKAKEVTISTFDLSKLSNKIDLMMMDSKLCIVSNSEAFFAETKEDIFNVLTSNTEKRTFDAKSLYEYGFSNGIEIKNIIFDATLAGYLLNATASEYTFNRLCEENSIPFNKDDENSIINALTPLLDVLEKRIDETKMNNLLSEIEIPLAEVLASMEHYGFSVDKDGIINFGNGLKEQIDKLETYIYELAGKQFNISSPKQLGEILFENLGLPAKKKTKSGYSTNAEVLEGLRKYHPIIDAVLEYRKLTKLNSTYVEGLLKVIGDDGKIHSYFRQTETRTGRISSTEPNLQNIPVRTELGRNMRKFFIAPKGRVLLDADYSQIELRVLAHISNDEVMINGFASGEDIHAITASQVFDMPLDFVDKNMRSAAKAVNFGIVYGIGAFSLSQDIGVTVAEADRYIKNYLNKYSGVSKYMETVVENGKADGYVTTMFGRRRYVPELNSSNGLHRAFGKRVAMNAPIQGTAADIIKLAMVNVYKKLKEENLDARLILQVHDELIVEASTKDADKAAEILQTEMESAVKMNVKLVADVGRGKSWFEAH